MDSPGFLSLDPQQCGLSEPLSKDLTRLNSLLGRVLGEQEGASLTALARRLMAGDPIADIPELHDPKKLRQLARAFTVLFQLANTAEQKEIVRVNRARNDRRESIDESVAQLKARGCTANEMRDLLSRVEISPTLTAHPTEAKRRAVLDKLLQVALLLDEVDAPLGLKARLDADTLPGKAIQHVLTELWQTDEMRSERLTVTEEVRNALYFFERTIMEVVPWLHEDLQRALERYYPGEPFEVPTILSYRSWVGGDRDGNPNVTPEITWNTLLEHRIMALETYLRHAADLRRELTQSTKLVPVSEALLNSLAEDEAWLPYRPEQLKRYSQEPYVRKMLGIEIRLQDTLEQAQAMRTSGRRGGFEFCYVHPDELLRELRLVQQSLAENRAAETAATGRVPHLIRQVQAFGFHLATLDIRQHSDQHSEALEEILHAAGVLAPDVAYESLDEAAKVALITTELANPRPLLPTAYQGSEAVTRVLEVFHVVRRARSELSTKSVVAYVISMTHGLSDILEVLLFAKESGLLRINGDSVESDLDVVPLFETIEDLHHSGPLMRELFENEAYKKHLAARGSLQEVMLGYSDSSKDGGYVAANWSLQSTLAELAKVSHETRVPIRLFHGRGGTVGRGGGRANKAILSQPEGSFQGKIRFTEQGEVVSFRYALPPIAHRHLEQIVGAALLATHGAGPKGLEARFGEVMGKMEETSRKAYRGLVYETEGFWSFYNQATPILHISLLPIASRPVSRGGNTLGGVEGLRAIPWNFAWVQSRATLVGWYGLGMALKEQAATKNGLETLKAMYREWTFFQMVIDNAQLELMRAHLPTARLYAARVEPAELGQEIQSTIEEEFIRTRESILAITGQTELMARARVVRNTVEFRNPMVEPLSAIQIHLMNQWDGLTDDDRTGVWREAMLQSIAGIAAAMQSTG